MTIGLLFIPTADNRIWWRNTTSESPGSKPSASLCGSDLQKPTDLNFPKANAALSWCSGTSFSDVEGVSKIKTIGVAGQRKCFDSTKDDHHATAPAGISLNVIVPVCIVAFFILVGIGYFGRGDDQITAKN